MRLTFSVEGIPQGKGRARSTIINAGPRSFVSHYTPKKTREYEEGISYAAAAVMFSRPPLDEAVRFGLVIRCSVPASWSRRKRQEALSGFRHPAGKPDIDNSAKAVLDALNGIVWRDDSLVCEVAMVKRYAERPGIDVTIETLAAAERENAVGTAFEPATPPPADPFAELDDHARRQEQKREDATCSLDF